MDRLKKRKCLVVQYPEHKDIASFSTEDYVINKWNERPITKYRHRTFHTFTNRLQIMVTHQSF